MCHSVTGIGGPCPCTIMGTGTESPVPVPALPWCVNEGGRTCERQKLNAVRRQTRTWSFNWRSRDASRGPAVECEW